MSKTIDERVVEMRFDNQQFERNVQTSMSSLDKLKQSLNMDGAAKGFQEVSAEAGKINLGPLGSAVESVKMKFSALEVMAITALANITSAAIDAGANLVRSLAIEPIKQGFEEYELKMGSVQTIMASTGKKIEVVNDYLEELNHYADKTIYSFSDMTANIGKFTNSGVELDDAVKAIQGISNAAALSGANAQQASHAMYNFAQAISSGYVKLIDWKSIELANMATVQFKQELLDTAVAMGTVVKEGDKYVTLTTNAKGETSELFNATSGFNDALQFQWMTTGVLTETLRHYSTDVRDMTKTEVEAYENKLRGLGFTEEQIKKIEELGEKSFDAAQDVKTFSQMMDSLKEAVGSGWAQTFEKLFGNLEEAKSFWGSIYKPVSDFIDLTSKARNDFLQSWIDTGGRDALLGIFSNLFNGLMSVIKPVKEAIQEMFPPPTAKAISDVTKAIRYLTSGMKLTATQASVLKMIVKEMLVPLKLVGAAASTVYTGLGKLAGVFVKFAESERGVKMFEALNRIFASLEKTVNTVTNEFKKLYSVVINSDQFKQLSATLASIGEELKAFGAGMLDNFINWLDSISQMNIQLPSFDEFTKGVLSAIEAVSDFLKQFTTGAFDKFSSFGFSIDDIKEKFQSFVDVVKKGRDKIVEAFSSVGSSLKDRFAAAGEMMGKASERFKEMTGAAETGIDKLEFGEGAGSPSAILEAFGLGGLVAGAVYAKQLIDKLIGGASDIVESINKVLDGVRKSLEAYQKSLEADTIKKIAEAIGILAASLVALAFVPEDKLQKAGTALGSIAAGLGVLAATMSKVSLTIDVKSLFSLGGAMFIMALAVSELAIPIFALSRIDLEKLAQGVGGVFAGMMTFVFTIKKLGGFFERDAKEIVILAAAMWVMAHAMNVLSVSIMSLSALDWDDLIEGLVGVAGGLGTLLGAFIGINKLVSSAGSTMIQAGVALLIAAAAMGVLTISIKALSNLKLEEIGAALLALGGGMYILVMGITALSAAAYALGGPAVIVAAAAALLIASAGLVAMALAVNMLVLPIKTLGEMDLDDLAEGVGAVIAAVLALAAAAAIAGGPKAVFSGAGFIMMATALNMLIVPIATLGKLPWDVVSQGLKALFYALAGYTGIGVVASLAAAGLLALTASMLGIATAVTIAGHGLMLVATALVGVAGAIQLFGNISGPALNAAVEGFKQAAVAMLSIMPQIGTGVGQAVITFAQTIASGAPIIADAINTVIVEALGVIVSAVPAYVESVYTILLAILEILDAKMPDILNHMLNFLEHMLMQLGIHLKPLTALAINAILMFVAGIRMQLPAIIQAGIDWAIALINGVADGIEKNTDRVLEAIDHLLTVLLNLLGQAIGKFSQKGVDIITGIIKGITSVQPTLLRKIIDIAAEMLVKIGVPKDWVDKAKSFVQGLIDGFIAMKDKVVNAVGDLAKSLMDKYTSIFKINSPSKVMMEMGRYTALGLVNGLESCVDMMAEAGEDLGNGLLDSVSTISDKIADVVEGDYTPVVSPVLDLTNIQNGVASMNGILDTTKSRSLAMEASVTGNVNSLSALAASFNKLGDMSNDDVVEAIDQLREDMGNMMAAIGRFKVVMDTGTLVGAISPEMDAQLGAMAVLRERGV